MPYAIQQFDRLLVVRWSGSLVPEDLQAILREIPDRGRSLGYAPDVLHLFDGVEAVLFDLDDMIRHSRARGWTPIPNVVRSASVGSTPITLGIARMFRAINAHPMIQMEVFESEDAARSWLASPPVMH